MWKGEEKCQEEERGEIICGREENVEKGKDRKNYIRGREKREECREKKGGKTRTNII